MEKIPFTSEKKYTFEGLFDLKSSYKSLLDYIENSLYYYDVTVKDYEEVNIKGTKKIMSKIETEKLYNDYFKIILKFEVLMEGKDIEGEINNKKLILTQGKAQIKLNGYIEPDYQGNREKNPLRKFLGQIYDKFVGNDDLDKCMEAAGGDVGKVIARFKEHLNATIK